MDSELVHSRAAWLVCCVQEKHLASKIKLVDELDGHTVVRWCFRCITRYIALFAIQVHADSWSKMFNTPSN